MSKLNEFLLNERTEAYLIEDENEDKRTKKNYVQNAEEGTIIAFRLNFSSKDEIPLTKVISGKIVENDKEKEMFVAETRNGLKYGVPYNTVVWVKTGERWPKGVYEEMKQGAVLLYEQAELDFGDDIVDSEK